ncbi:MAG: GNAT family N-acetyltransferase [Pseudomonadota bacterium]
MADIEQISGFLKELTASGKRKSPDSEAFVRAHYIEDKGKISCTVAQENGLVLGFQSLKRATAGNKYGVEPGWGIIGTHVRPSAARRGVGRALFAVSQKAAIAASLRMIDASIANNNPDALAYYDAIGFQTYRQPEGLVCKCFDLTEQQARAGSVATDPDLRS